MLSRLVSEGVIRRIDRGVFMCPKTNRFVGTVTPVVRKVVEVMAKDRGEPIQLQDAEAASRSTLFTQILQRSIFVPVRISELPNWKSDDLSLTC